MADHQGRSTEWRRRRDRRERKRKRKKCCCDYHGNGGASNTACEDQVTDHKSDLEHGNSSASSQESSSSEGSRGRKDGCQPLLLESTVPPSITEDNSVDPLPVVEGRTSERVHGSGDSGALREASSSPHNAVFVSYIDCETSSSSGSTASVVERRCSEESLSPQPGPSVEVAGFGPENVSLGDISSEDGSSFRSVSSQHSTGEDTDEDWNESGENLEDGEVPENAYNPLPRRNFRDAGLNFDGGNPDDYDNPDDPDDPDDPDNPDDSDSSDDEEADVSSDEDDTDNFNWNNARLDRICRSVRDRSVREVLALHLAVAVRHNYTYEAILDNMGSFNDILGRKHLPTNKKMLWKLLDRKSLGIRRYAYCHRCYRALGRIDNLNRAFRCATCNFDIPRRKVKYFVSLSLRKRLKRFLQTREISEALNDRGRREGRNEGVMEDILDSENYKDLQQRDGPLSSLYHYSYTFNSDGFRLTRSSKLQAWPIFIRVNELPISLRQKHLFLAGLWVDEKEPNMNDFLLPFVRQANRLSSVGINWVPHGGGEQLTSKFIPTCCVADSKARASMLNLVPPSGYYGCNFCSHVGLYAGNSVKFPYLPPVPIPARRTDEGIKASMRSAFEEGHPVEGLKGPSALMNLDYFNLGWGFSSDDLHPLFLGVASFHFHLLLSSANEPRYYIGDPQNVGIINRRLMSIRTPTHISRKPRPIGTRRKWTGTEWRNMLLYYLYPCLNGVLPHEYLSHLLELAEAVFLLSRDVIEIAQIEVAEELLRSYVSKFERYFHTRNMRYNVHILLHVPECVRHWGPLYVQSTFDFESWNHTLMKKFTSPNGALDQIINRYLMSIFLSEVDYNAEIGEDIKAKVREIMSGQSHPHADFVDRTYLLGKSEERMPTEVERQLLLDEGRVCDRVTSYQRAIFGSREYRTDSYRYAGEEGRSDNSYIYTRNDEFGRICSIFKFVDNEGNSNVRVLIRVLNTNNPIAPATYILQVQPEEQEVHILETFAAVRNHAVMITFPHGSFVMPVANPHEID